MIFLKSLNMMRLCDFMDDVFIKYSDAVLREYLKLHKPIRTFFDEHLDCSDCDPKDCCCIHENTGLRIFTAWDHHVFQREHPGYYKIGLQQDDDDPVCAYVSETGCILEGVRPSTCTRYICSPKKKKINNYGHAKVFGSFHRISLDMQGIITNMFSHEKEKKIIRDIDKSLKNSAKIIKKDKMFSEKYEYESIF